MVKVALKKLQASLDFSPVVKSLAPLPSSELDPIAPRAAILPHLPPSSGLQTSLLNPGAMVINPTYLAQRTRTCMLLAQSLKLIVRPLTKFSGELARCQAEGDHLLSGMAQIRQYSQFSSYSTLYTGAYMSGPKAPEIQQTYSLNMPVSALRTKVRQEFERHRYVQQLPVVDMLIFQSHVEYQVRARVNTVGD